MSIVKRLNYILENHNIEVDLDLAGDLAQLKKNLAKLRKGKHGNFNYQYDNESTRNYNYDYNSIMHYGPYYFR